MRTLLAISFLLCYTCLVESADLPKSCFNMVVVSQPEKPRPVEVKLPIFSHRQPIGHTHTCANGHTWDHTANPTHRCQFCGLAQNIQDRSPQLVTVNPSTTRLISPITIYQNCPNGQCPNVR